jgi:hypothetical protein
VSGFLALGAVTLLVIAVVGAVATGITRLAGGSPGAPRATIGPGWSSWLRSAMILSAPSALFAAGALIFPLNYRAIAAPTWIQSLLVLSAVLTAGVLLSHARGRIAEGAAGAGRSAVWRWWWGGLWILAGLLLLRQWRVFGRDPEAFAASLQAPAVLLRATGLLSIAGATAVLAGLVWLVWTLVGRLRGRPKAGPGGFMRTLVVLALWGGLVTGVMTIGAFRLYYLYDARLTALTVSDFEDEIEAWMGPAWYRAFFESAGGDER